MTTAQLSEQIGNVKEYKITNEGILIIAENAKMLMSAYSPTIVRVRVVRNEFGKTFPMR